MGTIKIEIEGELAEGLTAFDLARAVDQLVRSVCVQVRTVHVSHDGQGGSADDGGQVRWFWDPAKVAEVRERNQARDN